MRRWGFLLTLLLAIPPAAGAAPSSFEASTVLVALKAPGQVEIDATGRASSSEPRLAALLRAHGLERGRAVGRGSGAPGRRGFLRLESWRPDFDPIATAEALRASGLVTSAIPNYQLHLFPTLPADPYLHYQWHVQEVGDADVDLPEAWDVEKGDTSVVIGIVDTGVDITHPDLASQIWTNPGEVAGNGVDDDGNGLVDDVHGWNFGMGNNDPNPGPMFDPSGIDVGFHGTFVAGTASAATNNGVGIAGAGWRCRLMPLRVADSTGVLLAEAVSAAFLYAADQGVEVLNVSLGGAGDPGVPEFFQALVDTAIAHGVLVVAAAGNDGTDVPSYPAGCDGVLAVAATDETNARATFSNWGAHVDVAAPGELIWSTLCQNYVFDDLTQIIYLLFFGWDGETPYMYGDGTSFACPIAAGVCGLVRSKWPMLTPGQTLAHVVATGDLLTFDHPIGPKLNAYRAVTEPVVGVALPAPVTIRLQAASPNPFATVTTLRFALAAAGHARLVIYDCGGRRVRNLVDAELPAGGQRVRWDGRADDGRPLGSGVYFAQLEHGGAVSRRSIVLMR